MGDRHHAAATVLRDEDVQRLVDHAGETPAGLRMAALVSVLHHACPRLGVALGAHVEDVRLGDARIRLRGRRDWEVELDVPSLARLSRWVASRATLGLGTTGILFCTFDGAPLDDSYVRRELGALGRRAGLDAPVSAERLRRSGIARLIAAGVGDERLQQRLDHGRPGVTARYRRRFEPGPAPRDVLST
jgi:site-specific recombinase XerD